MDDLEQIGIDAVDRFLETWNSRDPLNWAGSLNYPHVRPAPKGPINIAGTAEEYAAAFDYQPVIDSGWDHSEWDYKHVLHLSANRIHVAGQWSRYSAEGNVIATTPILYICTRVDGHWGIQSRFAVDYVDEDTDNTEMLSRGLALVQDYINQHNSGNRDACAELFNYPHLAIDVGNIHVTDSAEQFVSGAYIMTADSMIAVQTGRHAMNIAADLTVSENGQSVPRQAIVNINDRDGHLGIQAWSIIDPTDVGD